MTALSPKPRPTIAVFDSGVGGLTVLRAVAARVPDADYLYFGDTARLPYGAKSRETIARYVTQAARFLEKLGAGLLVIGCNTASALALYDVKSAVSIPVIGVIEPGADRAAEISASREAVVFATEATVASHAYQRALARRGFATHEKACPLLVPLVEEGWTDHPVTEQVARIYTIEALRVASVNTDVLVLGCTHYPLIQPLLRRVVPQRIQIVDSADCTAHAVQRELGLTPQGSQDAPSRPPASGSNLPSSISNLQFTARFYVTDSVEKFRRMAPLFLGCEVKNVEHVDLEG